MDSRNSTCWGWKRDTKEHLGGVREELNIIKRHSGSSQRTNKNDMGGEKEREGEGEEGGREREKEAGRGRWRYG